LWDFSELEENRVERSEDEEEPYSLEHSQSSMKEDDLQLAKVPKSGFTNKKLKAQSPSNYYKKKNLKKLPIQL
jgi:hypothetical protein